MSGASRCPTPDLETLAKVAKSQTIIPTQLEFVDIAGLVRGASKGEGLGNQFLAHIREVDAVIYVAALLREHRHYPCRGFRSIRCATPRRSRPN